MPRSYCKPHYLAAFALRGKYDDIGKEAAAPAAAPAAEGAARRLHVGAY